MKNASSDSLNSFELASDASSSISLFRDSVRERDLDNFLVEELSASVDFRSYLMDKLGPSLLITSELAVRIQKSPPRLQDNRQTDVRLGWFDGPHLKACVLIESKVTAGFQPGQAESYARELAECQARLGKSQSAAILVAPRTRLSSLQHENTFTVAIAIEDIITFLRSRLQVETLSAELAARLEARVGLLEALCGKRATSPWTPLTVAAKRDFADAYANLAGDFLPNFPVRASCDGQKAITRIFDACVLAPILPRATLRHEFGKGHGWKYVNIQFQGLAHKAAVLRNSGMLKNTGLIAVEAGKSLAIRIPTPAVDPTKPFTTQETAVRNGLAAAQKLVVFLEKHATRLNELLT